MRSSVLAGAVLIAAVVGMTWFVMTTTKDKYSEDSTYPVSAEFSDAAGIRWKTRVQISGIDIGKIETISHARGKNGRLTALVRIRLLDDYDLYTNAEVRKAAESLLGDFRLDLDPGAPQDSCDESGDCKAEGFACRDTYCIRDCLRDLDCPAPMICGEGVCAYGMLPKDGTGLIGKVESKSDLDEIQSQLKVVARNVARVSESVANVLGGAEGEGSMRNILHDVEASMKSINDATRILATTLDRNDDTVERVIKNLGQISNDLAVTMGAGGDVNQSAENIASLTKKLDDIAGSLQDMMESSGSEDVSVRDTLAQLNETLANLAEITRKVDEGKGTVGRLINDDTVVKGVEGAVEDVGELIGGLARMQTEVEWRSQFEVPFGPETESLQASVKNIIGVRIKPKPDKWYMLELVSDPRGSSTRVIETKCVLDAAGKCPATAAVATQTTKQAFNELKFSAQFAKRFYFFALRFGIIENTGGVGANFYLFDDDLELRLDAFDFTRRDPTNQIPVFPRFRAALMYEFIDHIAIQAGLDDPFNETLRTWFVGGRLRFTDEDLKMLLAVAPTP